MKRIRRLLAALGATPLHPQWFALRNQKPDRDFIRLHAGGVVLDIGCANRMISGFLPEGCHYIGLDYFETAHNWYGSRPDVYGDAQNLPVASSKVDTVLLLDVLEHLPRPERCISEIARVLKPQGKLIMQVPFIYPIHDAPLDFQRWTRYGFEEMAKKQGFKFAQITSVGEPLEAAALLTNIAMSKTVVNWIKQKNPAAVLVIFLPPLVLLFNVLAWAFCRMALAEEMMPIGYRLLLLKE